MIKSNITGMMGVSLILLVASHNAKAQSDAISTLGCMLEPSKKVEVSSPVAGVLDRVNVERGSKARLNRVLFTLKAGVQHGQVKLAKVKAEFAKRKAVRNKDLYQDDILSVHERDEIETDLMIAESELYLKQQELALRSVQSPISGVVVNVFKSKGEYVNVEPVMELATLDPLHIDLLLPSSYFGQITVGEQLMIKPEAANISENSATVKLVDPIIDPASSTFRVQLVMSNPDNTIPAGIPCTARKSDSVASTNE